MAIWLQWLLAVQLSLFVPILTSPNARDVLCVCVRVSPPPLVNCDCFQMGMGKTIQTIALIVHRPSTAPPRRPTLVVAPTVALFQVRLSLCVCMCVCVCVPVCTYVNVYVCECARVCACAHACGPFFVRVSFCVHLCHPLWGAVCC